MPRRNRPNPLNPAPPEPADVTALARFTQLQADYATLQKEAHAACDKLRAQIREELRHLEAEEEAERTALADRYAVVTNYTPPDKEWVREHCWEQYRENVPGAAKDDANMRAAVERYAESVHTRHRYEYLAQDGNIEQVIALMEAKARGLAEAGRKKQARRAYDLVEAMKGGSGVTHGTAEGA